MICIFSEEQRPAYQTPCPATPDLLVFFLCTRVSRVRARCRPFSHLLNFQSPDQLLKGSRKRRQFDVSCLIAVFQVRSRSMRLVLLCKSQPLSSVLFAPFSAAIKVSSRGVQDLKHLRPCSLVHYGRRGGASGR
jgi:hypothetical protein